MTMESYCGKDLVKLFPELGQTASDFDWMFQLDKESQLMNSMCRYLDFNHILEEHEIESYLEWEANNTFDEMESPVEPNNTNDIWNVVDDNMLRADEIAASENLLVCLPKRSKTLKHLLVPSEKENNNSQHKCEKAQQLYLLASDGCHKFSCCLHESYSEIVKNFENLAFFLKYEDNKVLPQFFVHYPVDEMKQEKDRFSNVLRLMLKILAPAAEAKLSDSNSIFRFIINGDAASYERLLKLIALLIEKLLKTTLESIFTNFDNETILTTMAALEDVVQQMNSGHTTDNLNLESTSAFEVESYQQIKTILQRKEKNKIVVCVMNKFSEECQSTETDYLLKIKRLEEVSTLIQEQKDLNQLMGILYQLDRVTIKNIEKLLLCLINSLPDHNNKVEEVLNHDSPNLIEQDQSMSPPPITTSSPPGLPNILAGISHNLLMQANNGIALKQEEILHSIRLLLAYFSQRKKSTNKLENYIISGATSKPVVIDYGQLLTLQGLEVACENGMKELLEAHLFVERMEHIWKQNPGLKTLKLLWVPFMNGNAGRLEAIATGDFSLSTIKKKQIGSHRKKEWASVKKDPDQTYNFGS